MKIFDIIIKWVDSMRGNISEPSADISKILHHIRHYRADMAMLSETAN